MNDISFKEKVLRERQENLKARLKGIKNSDLAAMGKEVERWRGDWDDFQREKSGAEAARAAAGL
jgi:hypothetical protein